MLLAAELTALLVALDVRPVEVPLMLVAPKGVPSEALKELGLIPTVGVPMEALLTVGVPMEALLTVGVPREALKVPGLIPTLLTWFALFTVATPV